MEFLFPFFCSLHCSQLSVKRRREKQGIRFLLPISVIEVMLKPRSNIKYEEMLYLFSAQLIEDIASISEKIISTLEQFLYKKSVLISAINIQSSFKSLC